MTQNDMQRCGMDTVFALDLGTVNQLESAFAGDSSVQVNDEPGQVRKGKDEYFITFHSGCRFLAAG